jgi:hypothetical protein
MIDAVSQPLLSRPSSQLARSALQPSCKAEASGVLACSAIRLSERPSQKRCPSASPAAKRRPGGEAAGAVSRTPLIGSKLPLKTLEQIRCNSRAAVPVPTSKDQVLRRKPKGPGLPWCSKKLSSLSQPPASLCDKLRNIHTSAALLVRSCTST